MDKVKQILTVLRRHHFWILCGVVALIGLIIWYSASNKLAAQFKRDSENINQTITKLKQIQSPHPNETWIEGIGKKTDALRQDVAAVWTELYKQQKELVFVWPPSLGKDFLTAIAAIEVNPQQKLPENLRERYQNMIKREAARLAEIVDAAVPEENAIATTKAAEEAAAAGQPDHRVHWAQLADIQSSFDWDEPPSTQMILFMQEELWVYKALCNVIQDVNKGSTGPHDAPITDIMELSIAYAAVETPYGRMHPVMHFNKSGGPSDAGVPSAGGESPEKQRPDFRNRGKATEARSGAPAEGETAVADPDTLYKGWRYVKETGEPLMSGDLASAPAEYNLMPFRLILMIEPRDLDRFLVDLRNSILPIEVREIQINPTGAAALLAHSSGERETTSTDVHRHTERVEICGVVYLIKPPDLKALGITPAPEAAAPESTEAAASAPPAAAAAPGAAAAVPPATEPAAPAQPAAQPAPAEQPPGEPSSAKPPAAEPAPVEAAPKS